MLAAEPEYPHDFSPNPEGSGSKDAVDLTIPRTPSIDIPPPSAGLLERAGKSGAVKELLAFSKDSESWMRRWKWGGSFVIAYQALLFIFALGINWWWAKNVLALLWQSGREGTKFHLNDGVLIALVTTSVANFLALVLIIARNLFPGKTDQ